MKHGPIHFRSIRNRGFLPARRGVIFVTALGIIVILTGLALVFAQSMRTEASASAFRLSSAQADGIEQGAEQWVMGQIDSYPANAVEITEVPAEALPLGSGYFWILHVDPTQDQQYTFGITDECSKLNLNGSSTLLSTNMVNLPNLTQDVVDNILSWRLGASYPNGAQSDYYDALPEPYETRADVFTGASKGYETVEELLLVENLTPQMLFGSDLNRNGVIELSEQNAAGSMTLTTGTTSDTRGFYNYVTCYSSDPAGGISAQGSNVVAIGPNGQQQLQSLLSQQLGGRASSIVNNLYGNRRQPPQNLSSLQNAGMQKADWAKVFDGVSGAQARVGAINVNTASQQALMGIGITQSDASTIVATRTSQDLTTSAWFFNNLPGDMNLSNVIDQLTGRSFQYSADIVAVSGDGRAFKRVRIVVDASSGQSKIVYRQDLTSLGWPLDPAIRTAMRSGKAPPDAMQTQ